MKSRALQNLQKSYRTLKEEKPGISVTSWRIMCPKRGEAGCFGNKLREHVPVKSGNEESLEQVGRTCARKEEETGITVTSWRNMCPKRGGSVDFGNKLEQHVPEKRRSRRFRKQVRGTCARKEEKSGISVTSWRIMCPKRGEAVDFGNKLREHVPVKSGNEESLEQVGGTTELHLLCKARTALIQED
ncbi:hypothetical protein [Mesobacillus subterraneus]|uniref:hypothetical protein n=1 Tax=Mesobacillus subterraneus TaxID=285983 RepID=UPI001CFE6373|nr:hypothetical protein [Mesobacillus subterraneus]